MSEAPTAEQLYYSPEAVGRFCDLLPETVAGWARECRVTTEADQR
jgi:hypothetical protein